MEYAGESMVREDVSERKAASVSMVVSMVSRMSMERRGGVGGVEVRAFSSLL